MITSEITFHRPGSLAEALDLLATHGDEAKLLGGGMSLVPTMTLGLARPEILISLNHVPELREITRSGGVLRIGGTARHADLLASPLVATHAPLLAEAARHIGDVQVRNRGTIGGSVAHADPAADYLPTLVVLGADVVVRSTRGERVIPASAFFVDVMATALEPDELVAEIRVPDQAGATGAYRRLARVEGSFAIVNAAALVHPGGAASVAIGGVAATPVVVDAAAAVADGLSDSAVAAFDDAVRAACPDPFEDLNGDAEYRREMAVIHARRALFAAAGRAG